MSLQPQYFDALYAEHPDPWRFRTRWYEQRKYAATLASLPREHYENAFEPGCSIGVLTALLARRCSRLLATDPAEAAVEATRRAVAGPADVEVRRGRIPQDWPPGTFDLIVLSEFAYYLDRAALDETVAAACASLSSDGDLVAVHWRHPVPDYPLTGDEVHEVLRATPGLTRVVAHEEKDFWLEVFRRGPAVSVAEAEGLA